MKLNLAQLKQIQSRKRGAAGAPARPEEAAAKKPRPTVAVPPPSRAAEVEEEDEVEIVPDPTAATPIPAPPPPPVPAPEPEGAQAAAERRRKGKEVASSSAPAPSEEEVEMLNVGYSVPASASALGDRALSREILRTVLLPVDVESRKNRPMVEVARSLYLSLFKLLTDISVLEDGAAGFAKYAKTARTQVEASKAEAEAAKELQKAGELRESQLQEELRNVREAGTKYAADVKELRDQLVMEQETSRTLREDLAAADLRARKAEEEKQAESARAEAAEKEKEAEMARARAAEERFANFRNSAEYANDIGENCLEALHLGFQECRDKVALAYPDLDLSIIQEYEDGGDTGTAEEEVVEKGGTGAVEATEAVEAEAGEVAPTMGVVVGLPAVTVGAGSESAPVDSQEGT